MRREQARARALICELRCPYCHAAVLAGWRCSECAALHHEECAEQHGGCSVFACRGRLASGARVARARLVSRPSRMPAVVGALAVAALLLLGAAVVRQFRDAMALAQVGCHGVDPRIAAEIR